MNEWMKKLKVHSIPPSQPMKRGRGGIPCSQWGCTFALACVLTGLLLVLQTTTLVNPVESFDLHLSPGEDFIIPINVLWQRRVEFLQRTDTVEGSNTNFGQRIEKLNDNLGWGSSPEVFLFDHRPRMTVEVLRRRFESEFTVPSSSFRARARRLPCGSALDVHWRGYMQESGTNATTFLIVFRGEESFRQWERVWEGRLAVCEAYHKSCIIGQQWYCKAVSSLGKSVDPHAAYCSPAVSEGRMSLRVPEGGYMDGNIVQGLTYYFVWGSAGPGGVVTGPGGGGDELLLRVDTEWGQRAYDVSTGWSLGSTSLTADDSSSLHDSQEGQRHIPAPQSIRYVPHSMMSDSVLGWRGDDRTVEFSLGYGGMTHLLVSNSGDSPMNLLCVIDNRAVLYTSAVAVTLIATLVVMVWTYGRKTPKVRVWGSERKGVGYYASLPFRSIGKLVFYCVSGIITITQRRKKARLSVESPNYVFVPATHSRGSSVEIVPSMSKKSGHSRDSSTEIVIPHSKPPAIKRRNTGPSSPTPIQPPIPQPPPPDETRVNRATSDPVKPPETPKSTKRTPRRRREKKKQQETPKLFDKAPGRPTPSTPSTAPPTTKGPTASDVAMRAIGLGDVGGIFSGSIVEEVVHPPKEGWVEEWRTRHDTLFSWSDDEAVLDRQVGKPHQI